jgi:hypothetical protein
MLHDVFQRFLAAIGHDQPSPKHGGSLMSLRHRVFVASLLTFIGVAGWFGTAAFAQNDNGTGLQSLLEQVGQEYAESYLAPLTNAMGANQNSALYHTAHIPGSGLTFGIALKFMGSYMSEDDQTFSRVFSVPNMSDYVDGASQDAGLVEIRGPSVIGDTETKGTITGYVNGWELPEQETIGGLLNTRWVPFAAPEASIGGIIGAKLTVRWLPEIDLDKYGKTKYFGWGLQFSPNKFLSTLPLDVAVGFFKQEIDFGTVVKTEANSVFLAASKSFGLATLYGGFAKENGKMNVSYTEDTTAATIDFEVESIMKSRFTVGTTLNLGVKLYGEANFGQLSVYSAGLIVGM